MITRNVRTTVAALVATTALVTLAACGGGEGDEPEATGTTEQTDGGDDSTDEPEETDGTEEPTDDAAAFPVTITHAYGETTIPSEPVRVVAWDWSTQDAVIALGVAPIGMPTYSYGGNDEGVLPWVADALEAGGMETPTLLSYGGEVPFEEIDALDPDLILAVNSGISEADFETLSVIAPTVAQPGDIYATPWQEQLTMVGDALGRPDDAAAMITETEDLIAAQAEANPELVGAEFVYTSGDVSTGNLPVYAPTDVRVQLLVELGMTIAPWVEANVPSDGNFSFDVSLETVDAIEADVLVAWFGDEAGVEAFETNPLVAQIPAVASGGFAPVVGADFVMATSAVSALSIAWALDDYVPVIADAVAAAG